MGRARWRSCGPAQQPTLLPVRGDPRAPRRTAGTLPGPGRAARLGRTWGGTRPEADKGMSPGLLGRWIPTGTSTWNSPGTEPRAALSSAPRCTGPGCVSVEGGTHLHSRASGVPGGLCLLAVGAGSEQGVRTRWTCQHSGSGGGFCPLGPTHGARWACPCPARSAFLAAGTVTQARNCSSQTGFEGEAGPNLCFCRVEWGLPSGTEPAPQLLGTARAGRKASPAIPWLLPQDPSRRRRPHYVPFAKGPSQARGLPPKMSRDPEPEKWHGGHLGNGPPPSPKIKVRDPSPTRTPTV